MAADQPGLADKYAGMHASFAEALDAGAHRAGRPPRPGEPGWGASLVIRLSGPVAQRLADLAQTCGRAARGPALVYGADELHVTVRSIEGFRGKPLGDARRGELCRYVEAALAGIGPFDLRLTGLAGGGDTLLACGYPGPELARLREALHRHRDEVSDPGAVGGDGERIRDTAHASLLVFREQPEPEPGVAEVLREHRATALGTYRVDQLALVEYAPTMTSAGLRPLATFTLA